MTIIHYNKQGLRQHRVKTELVDTTSLASLKKYREVQKSLDFARGRILTTPIGMKCHNVIKCAI